MATEIVINGRAIPLQSGEGIAASFEVSTDNFLNRDIAPGINPDNTISSLTIPWTLEAAEVLGPYDHPGHRVRDRKFAAPIYTDGRKIFDGQASVRDVISQRSRPTFAVLDFSSGATDILQAMRQVRLRTLELGSVEFSRARQEASWVRSYNDGYNEVWAPVVYGRMDPADIGNFPVDTLRPHIYFRAIVDAIGEAMGITFVSNFFDLDFFKSHTYLFGVGDSWVLGGSNSKYVRASDPNGQTIGSTATIIEFTDETTGANSDVDGVFNGTVYTPGFGDWYEVEVRFANALTDFTAYVEITNGSNVIQSPIPGLNGGIVGPFQLGTGGEIRIYGESVGVSSDLDPGSYVIFRRFGNPALGSSVELASCLHDRTAYDFIAGLTHMFNLAFAYVPETQEMIVEPRFDYEIEEVTYPGFYANLGSTDYPEEDWRTLATGDNEIQITRDYPLGNYVEYKMKTEPGEVTERLQRSGQADAPFMGTKYKFTDQDTTGGITQENPYFEDLYSCEDYRFLYLPLALSDYKAETKAEAPTYKTNPKFGFYAGVQPLGTWKYDGVDQTFLPYIFGKPVITTSGPVKPFSASMGDHLNYISGQAVVPGYVTLFYQRYLDIIQSTVTVSRKQLTPLSAARQENFRRLRILDLGTGPEPYILIRIEGFDPEEKRMSTVILARHTPALDDGERNVTHDTRRSGFTPDFS